jgi:PAS domain S-box-containing protein
MMDDNNSLTASYKYEKIYAMEEDKGSKEEKRLQEALEYSNAIIATVREPLLVLDKKLTIITANRSFYRTFRVNPEETEKRLIYELGNRQWDIPGLRELLEEILPMNTSFEDFEVEHDFEAIGRKTMMLNARKIHRETNNVEMILLAIEDITERKKGEDEAKRLNDEIEKKNKELEEIIDFTSHDLRSPLISVIGFSKNLEENFQDISSIIESDKSSIRLEEMLTPLIKDISESIGYVRSSALNMDALLTGLSKVLRIGYVPLEKEQLDMNMLISDIKNIIEFQMKETGAALEISDLPPCIGDKDQIHQLFANLLGNALKYLDPCRPGVIRVSGYVDENNQSVYCVEDNGIGISPEHHKKIFGMFHQIEPSRGKGQGLGLTIVSRILDRHNGNIWLESDHGKGSKFFVSLPAQKP